MPQAAIRWETVQSATNLIFENGDSLLMTVCEGEHLGDSFEM